MRRFAQTSLWIVTGVALALGPVELHAQNPAQAMNARRVQLERNRMTEAVRLDSLVMLEQPDLDAPVPDAYLTIPGPVIPGLYPLRTSGGNAYGGFNPNGGGVAVPITLPPDASTIRELSVLAFDGDPDVDIEVTLYSYVVFNQSNLPEGYGSSFRIATVETEGSTPIGSYLANPQLVRSEWLNTSVRQDVAYFLEIRWDPAVYLVLGNIRIGYDVE